MWFDNMKEWTILKDNEEVKRNAEDRHQHHISDVITQLLLPLFLDHSRFSQWIHVPSSSSSLFGMLFGMHHVSA